MVESINNVELISKDYPILKTTSSRKVVLFTSKGCGTVVSEDESFEDNNGIGYYSEDWAEYMFVIYEGEITLKNK